MITVKLSEIDALIMLLKRLKVWTDEKSVIALYKKMYENLIEAGAFDDCEFDVMGIVDNDWINYCDIVNMGDKDYKKLLKLYKEGERDVSSFCEEFEEYSISFIKHIKENFYRVICIPYCDAQCLLKYQSPVAFSSGAFGHDCDFYDMQAITGLNVCISTGYRTPSGRGCLSNSELLHKYETKARAILINAENYKNTQRSITKKIGVSRRLIQFFLFPERYQKNLADRAARGGSARYYDTAYQREQQRKYRNHLVKVHHIEKQKGVNK